jgi:hypothetical protein
VKGSSERGREARKKNKNKKGICGESVGIPYMWYITATVLVYIWHHHMVSYSTSDSPG